MAAVSPGSGSARTAIRRPGGGGTARRPGGGAAQRPGGRTARRPGGGGAARRSGGGGAARRSGSGGAARRPGGGTAQRPRGRTAQRPGGGTARQGFRSQARQGHVVREGGTVHRDSDFDTVLVVDFGAQYAQLIARRVRECLVYSEIVPCTMSAAEILAKRPAAIILSGGPASVYAPGAPPVPPGPPDLLSAGVPMLGICYGFQLMVSGLGGVVAHTGAGEYGATTLQTTTGGPLLAGTPKTQRVWMSHGDTASAAPPGFTVTAKTEAT